MMPASLHQFLARIDFGAVGGSLLMLDMILFAILAIHWEEAGRRRLFAAKRPTHRK